MKRVAVLALACVLMTVGAMQSFAQASGPWVGKKLGVAHITIYDEWCKAVYDEFKEQAKAMGFGEVNIQDGNLNAETQQKQVENFIAQKYDMIIIDPVSPDGIKKTLDKAKAAGIPVLAFDSGTDWSSLVTHVAWDHAETGRLTGKYVADYAKKNLGGKVKVGILAMLDAPHTAIRSVEFKKQLEADLGKSNVTYVFEQDFGQTRESAMNIVTNNLAKPMDIIWGAVDNAAMGARIALKNNGIDKTKVVSAGAWGAEPFNLLNAKDPWYIMCVGVSPANIVKATLESAKLYFQGKAASIPREQNTDLAVIDQSNISQYMKYVQK
ncbi:MAG: sugar ABC transporter substrate-binding protein [Spirochaetaceae bacterium]|nr:sugar ABC transporter substrate-binding protein [Spirochaetaceae bacterium]